MLSSSSCIEQSIAGADFVVGTSVGRFSKRLIGTFSSGRRRFQWSHVKTSRLARVVNRSGVRSGRRTQEWRTTTG